jgi:hypothetical protein
MRRDGDHDDRVARGYLFICLQPAEPVLGTRGSSGAALSQMVGAEAQVIRGGPRAAPSQKARAGAVRIHGGPRVVPNRKVRARAIWTHGGPGAAPSREAGAARKRGGHVAAPR